MLCSTEGARGLHCSTQGAQRAAALPPRCFKGYTVPDGELRANSITAICCGFVLQQADQQIHNSLTLTHSRRRLAIESRANHTSWCYVISRLFNNGVRNGELSRRIDNRNMYWHLLRNAAPLGHKIYSKYVNHPKFGFLFRSALG